MNQLNIPNKSPWLSLLTLVALAFGSAIFVQVIVLFLAVCFVAGISIFDPSSLVINFIDQPIYSYVMVISSSFGTFLLPAWLFQRIEKQYNYFPKQTTLQGLFLLLTVVFMIAFIPTMQWIADLNMKMSFPYSLKGIEDWMKEKEESMAILTKNMVMVDSWSRLFINLFAVAAMPAIAEEFFFRGAMMGVFQRMYKNTHVAIWVTAIIFSAIHVQFFGFIPRMLLGAFFGYMLLWTQNIWIPILAHFVNNGSAVILAFYYTKQGKTYEDLQSYEGFSIFMYIASFVLSIVVGWYFYNKSKNINNGKGLV